MGTLQKEFEEEEMRACALVLKDMLSREDLKVLNERFVIHRQEQDIKGINYEPWYVWFVKQLIVLVKEQ